MPTKLTLRLDDSLVKKAKKWSKIHQISLSEAIATFFEQLPDPDQPMELNPWTQSLVGILKKEEDIPEDQADLDILELAAAAGEIDLKYLDKSGFCLWSNPSYTYYPVGEQKRLEQTKRRGRRLSILGLLQPLISFVYGLVVGTISSKSYIEMMEQEAQQAAAAGRIRVIVQDNGSTHRCSQVQQLWSSWENQGLYIFFLPK